MPSPARAADPGLNKEKAVRVLVRVRPYLPRELQYDNAVEVLSVSVFGLPCSV